MLKQFDTRATIAIMLVVAIITMAFVLAFRPTSAPDSDVFKMLIGGLMTVGFATVIGFYFGSSSGSKDKDDTINQVALAQISPAANGNGAAAAPPAVPAAASPATPAKGPTP